MNDPTVIAAALVAVFAALGSLVVTIAMALKNGSKLEEIHVQTNSNMESALKRIEGLEEIIADLKDTKLQAALRRIAELESQVNGHGST